MNQVFAQPVGSGPFTRRPSIAAPLAYLLGITVGALTTALSLAAAGAGVSDDRASRWVLLALAAGVMVLAVRGQLRGEISPLPERRRQVPTRWLLWRRQWMTAVAFGYLLGMGVWTLLHHASAYVVLACLLLVSPAAAALAGLAYGLTRGGLLLAVWAISAGSGRFHRRITFLRVPLIARVLPYISALAGLAVLILYATEGV
jgi:hypothetical protein